MRDESQESVQKAVAMLKRAGATEENFWGPISKSEWLAQKVFALAEGWLKEAELSKAIFHLVSVINYDTRGKKCIDPVLANSGVISVELKGILLEKESYIGGVELIKRAKSMGSLTGLHCAEAMLKEQKKIPAECSNLNLLFPEVWEYSDCQAQFLFGISCKSGHWEMMIRRLDGVFGPCDRLVILCE